MLFLLSCLAADVPRAHADTVRVYPAPAGEELSRHFSVEVDGKDGPGSRRSASYRGQKLLLWNEVAHALSAGAELRENVDDVLFTHCDVIQDLGWEWTLRV